MGELVRFSPFRTFLRAVRTSRTKSREGNLSTRLFVNYSGAYGGGDLVKWRRGTLFITTTVMGFALTACGDHNIGSPANGTVAGALGAVGGPASGFRPFSK